MRPWLPGNSPMAPWGGGGMAPSLGTTVLDHSINYRLDMTLAVAGALNPNTPKPIYKLQTSCVADPSHLFYPVCGQRKSDYRDHRLLYIQYTYIIGHYVPPVITRIQQYPNHWRRSPRSLAVPDVSCER